MTTTQIPTASGSQLVPSFDRARVSDVMRHGVITCGRDVPLVTVARLMATHHVHAVVVTDAEAQRDGDPDEVAWGVVSERELLRAGAHAAELTAGDAAITDFPRVTADERLQEAGRKMLATGSTHAVVVTRERRAIGMVSSLDIAGVIAWGRA